MDVLDRFIELLKDGGWHEIEAVMRRAEVKAHARQPILSFLSAYGFIDVNKDKVKVSKPVLSFLT